MQQADPVKSAAASGIPGSKCSAHCVSDCYTRSTGTSPYCQLRPNYNVVVCSSCGSFPLRRNSDSSSFSLYSVRLLGMHQHVLQPFIFHLDIGIVKESLHYQCHSWRRERKRNQQENRKLPKIYKVNLGSKAKFRSSARAGYSSMTSRGCVEVWPGRVTRAAPALWSISIANIS